MYKVRTYNAISSKGLDRLSRDCFEVSSDINAPNALLLRSYKLADADIGDSVAAIARAGAGVNNIPIEHCTERGYRCIQYTWCKCQCGQGAGSGGDASRLTRYRGWHAFYQ
jgi:hypothetical protein